MTIPVKKHATGNLTGFIESFESTKMSEMRHSSVSSRKTKLKSTRGSSKKLSEFGSWDWKHKRLGDGDDWRIKKINNLEEKLEQ